MVEIKT